MRSRARGVVVRAFLALLVAGAIGLYHLEAAFSEAPGTEPTLGAPQGPVVHGTEDEVTNAASLHNLALVYQEQGRYAEAEPLFKRALAIYEKALGPEHPDVATILNNLAFVYRAQGRYAEAEPLFVRALAIYEKALGPEHPNVATSLNNLAFVYRAQGRYADAEPLYKRALAISEKALGPEHLEVATTLNNFARVYQAQGRYDAEPLFKRALAIREKALGPEHPDVATTLNSLALVYQEQGRYAEAEPLYKRALAISEKALGPEHPDVATILNNLAELYQAQGRDTDAEPLFKRALAISEKALGPEHPDVAATRNGLALVYQAQGRYAEAEPLYKRALAISEKALGPEHADVATILNNLAECYRAQGRYAEAEPLYKRALAISEKALGPKHADVVTILNNLALVYQAQGRYADAEPLLKRTRPIRDARDRRQRGEGSITFWHRPSSWSTTHDPGEKKQEAPPPPPAPPTSPDVSSKPEQGRVAASAPPARQSGVAALKAEEERQARAAAEAEVNRKAEQAEQQRLAALKAEEDRKAKAATEAEAKGKAEKAAPPPPAPSMKPDVSSKPGQGREVEIATSPVTPTISDTSDRLPDCRERLLAMGVYLLADQPCVDLDDLIKKLATGTYRFNKPESAYIDEPFRVVLVLSTAPGQDISRPFIGAPGNVEERTAPIARYLQATLRGGLDFRVIPPDPQPRTVTTSAPVVWEWTVVPLRHGKKSLVIDVAANLLVGPQKELVQLKTLSEEIQINVGLVRWITSTFYGLPGIALGLAAMLVVGLGALNYLRPGSVARGAAVLLAGDTMPAGARSKLRKAILDGFDHDSLDQVLRDNNMLSPDIGTGSLGKRVDSLIEVARQQGWLPQLCDALAAARSGNAPVSSAILAVRQSLTDQATRTTQPAVTSG